MRNHTPWLLTMQFISKAAIFLATVLILTACVADTTPTLVQTRGSDQHTASPVPRPTEIISSTPYDSPGYQDADIVPTLAPDPTVTAVHDLGKGDTAQGDAPLQEPRLNGTPASIPVLAKDAGRRTTREIVPDGHPLLFDVYDSTGNNDYPIFGSALSPNTDLVIDVTLAITTETDTPVDHFGGFWIGNYESPRKALFLVYDQGRWMFGRQDGDDWPIYQPILESADPSGRFVFELIQDSSLARIVLPDGKESQVELGELAFSGLDAVYLGVWTAPQTSVTIRHLATSPSPAGVFNSTLDAAEPLRPLADRLSITLGALPDPEWNGTDPGTLILGRHANLLVWHLAWGDEMNLLTSTRQAFAAAHNMRVRAHPLIWYADLPDWLEQSDFTPDELRGIMQERISKLMTRYPADEWVVVNEAVWTDDQAGTRGFSDNIFYRTFGPDYIKMAFQFAREADPNAVLIYNDYGADTPGAKADAVYNLLADMVQSGVPVDGVGLQYHLLTCNTPAPRKEEMIASMRRFASLGLDVYVTELDVNLVDLPGTQAEKWAVQAQIYRDVADACLESRVCKSITLWGLSDRFSWLNDYVCGGESPLLFDEDYAPKPAFFALRDALSKP